MFNVLKVSMRRLLHKLGWEVQLFRNSNCESRVLGDVLRLTGADVVLDVGANIGQFGDLLLSLGYAGRLVSFEAIPSVHAQLIEHARRRSESWRVAPCAALGSRHGSIDINISENVFSSSILPMGAAHLSLAPQSKYVDRQTVPIERLDELARTLVPAGARVFIKIDTQGYELEVLKGASNLLTQTTGMQIELSLLQLYEGAPTFIEMIEYMTSLGFSLFGVVPGFRDPHSGRLLQVDGFFTRVTT